MNNYLIKVNLARLAFILLGIASYFFYRNGLADYIVLISIVMAFGGLFATSRVELNSREVRIKKSYFWGIVSIKKILTYDQILSIETKEYQIDTHEEIGFYTENLFSFFTLEFLKPKVVWTTTKVSYLEGGKNKDIELKIKREDFKRIEKEIVSRDEYADFSRRGKYNS